MKALEKDRNRRYETASGLAADIERHLHDEPVEAAPPSAAYRFRKFALRNKAPFVTAALIAVALALGTVISTWQALRAEAQRYLAQENAAEAERSAENARAEAAKANAVVTLLQEMLGSANPDEAKGAKYTVRELLDDFSADLGNQLVGQPEVEASIRGTIGLAYRLLHLADDAEPHLKAALDLRRRTFGPDHEKVAEILVNYAWNHIEQHRHSEAEAHAREAVSIYRRAGATGRPLVGALWILHNALSVQGRFDDAEAVGDEAIAIARQSPEGEFPEVANILHRRAQTRNIQQRHAEAEQVARQSIEMHRRLHGSEHRETAWALNSLGRALYRQSKLPEAEAALREALAIFRQIYDDNQIVDGTSNLLQEVLRAKGDRSALEALAREELDVFDRKLGDVLLKRAAVHARFQHWEQAIDDYEEAIKLAPQESVYWEGRGTAYLMLGELDKAADDFAKLRELRPTTDLEIAHHYNDAGYALHGKRRLKEAELAYRQALLLKQKAAAAFPDNPSYRFHLTFTYSGLVAVLRDTNQLQEAAKLREEAVPIFEKVAADNPKSVERQLALPRFLRDAGNVDAALAQCSKILARNPELVDVWSLRGDCYLAKGEFAKAEEDFSTAIKLQPGRSEGWTGRAFAGFHRQQWEQAVADYSEAIELAPQVHTNWFHRGYCYLFLARWDKAAADFTMIIEGWPDDPGGWFLRALAYAQLNQPEKAITDLRQAIAKGLKDVVEHLKNAMLDPLRSTKSSRSCWPQWRRSRSNDPKKAAGEAYRQASSSPARHLPRRSVCAPRAMSLHSIADQQER